MYKKTSFEAYSSPKLWFLDKKNGHEMCSGSVPSPPGAGGAPPAVGLLTDGGHSCPYGFAPDCNKTSSVSVNSVAHPGDTARMCPRGWSSASTEGPWRPLFAQEVEASDGRTTHVPVNVSVAFRFRWALPMLRDLHPSGQRFRRFSLGRRPPRTRPPSPP